MSLWINRQIHAPTKLYKTLRLRNSRYEVYFVSEVIFVSDDEDLGWGNKRHRNIHTDTFTVDCYIRQAWVQQHEKNIDLDPSTHDTRKVRNKGSSEHP